MVSTTSALRSQMLSPINRFASLYLLDKADGFYFCPRGLLVERTQGLSSDLQQDGADCHLLAELGVLRDICRPFFDLSWLKTGAIDCASVGRAWLEYISLVLAGRLCSSDDTFLYAVRLLSVAIEVCLPLAGGNL